MAALRDLHPRARRSRSQARRQSARDRRPDGDRACARSIYAPRGGCQHLGGALRRHHCLGSRGRRVAVRARARQDLPPPDVLPDPGRGEDVVSAAAPQAAQPQAAPLFRYLLRLGDLGLVLGQRLGEWVGHAPVLEEDLGLANIALDLIGQARLLLSYAAEIEGRGRSEDDLAFLREHGQYLNPVLVEQPNGDFGQTIVRQVLIDAFQLELYERMLASTDERLAAIAAKAAKEVRYHLRYS